MVRMFVWRCEGVWSFSKVGPDGLMVGMFELSDLFSPCVFVLYGCVYFPEMTFGINSADVMRHLLREDVCRTVQGVKKLPFTQRLPFHLWHQRSFYPLYPAGQKASGQPEIAVDLGRADQLNLGDHKPDCMIMCSKLNHFATVRCGGVVGGWCFVCGEVLIFVFLMFFFVLVVVVVVQDCENVLCINPGRLTKGVSGGTYARIVIQPYNAAKLENQEDSLQLTHDMTERAAVEVRWWCSVFVVCLSTVS